MNILNMGTETYYRYKKMILTEAKQLWNQTVSEELEYRALKLKDYLQVQTRINEGIATDKEQPAKDRIEASEKMVNAQLKIYLILRDGPELDSR